MALQIPETGHLARFWPPSPTRRVHTRRLPWCSRQSPCSREKVLRVAVP